MVMELYLMYENSLPLRVSSEDAFKIRENYPEALILTWEQLQTHLEVKRMQMIYG